MKQFLFTLILAAQTVALLLYTLVAFQKEGASLFQIFYITIQQMGWNG